MGLGEVYEDKGLYREAIDEYKKVIELDAKHTGASTTSPWCTRRSTPRNRSSSGRSTSRLASQLPSEKDWVDVARQHLRKLKGQVKE